MTRQELTNWLEKNRIPYSRLAKEAGVGHYILLRWLGDPKTGISTRTIEKLQGAMFRLSNK